MSQSDLIKALRAQAAFERAKFALALSSSVKSQHDFVDGFEHAHVRLQPILERLIAVVEAAEKVKCCKLPSRVEGCSNERIIREVLRDLRAAVGMGE